MASPVRRLREQQELFDPESAVVRVRDKATGEIGTLQNIRGERRFIPDTASAAEGIGPFEAAMVEAGQFASTVFDRLDAIFGQPEAQQRVRRAEAALEPVREARPISTLVGGAIPGFAIPGGLPAQIGGGFLEGALQNVEAPLIGGTIGGALGGIGQKVGDALTLRRQARAARGPGMELAQQTGFPLTVAERTDSIVANWFDRQASTVLGRQVKGPSKQRALNKAFANSIGVDADILTGDVLGQAARQYSEVFESVAQGVDEIPLSAAFDEGLQRMESLAAELVPDKRALTQLQIVQDMAAGDLIDGKQYLRLRSRLGKISRNYWKSGGDQISGEFVDNLIGVLDAALTEAAPEAAEQLVPARIGWRQLVAMRAGSAISPQGDVNPVSMGKALERVYPGLDLNRFSPGAVGRAQRTNLAAQAFPAFRSSGTSERSILSAASIAPALVGTLGGGAGPQLSGGVARALDDTATALMAFLGDEESDDQSSE